MGKKLNISRFRPLLVSVLSILFGFAAGSLLLLASGVDPMECYLYLFRGGISTTTRIFNTLANAIPLIFPACRLPLLIKPACSTLALQGR